MHVEHRAQRVADLEHVLRPDPAGEPVVCTRLDRHLRRPTHVATLFRGDLHAAPAAVPDVRDGQLSAPAVRDRSPPGGPAAGLLFKGRIG